MCLHLHLYYLFTFLQNHWTCVQDYLWDESPRESGRLKYPAVLRPSRIFRHFESGKMGQGREMKDREKYSLLSETITCVVMQCLLCKATITDEIAMLLGYTEKVVWGSEEEENGGKGRKESEEDEVLKRAGSERYNFRNMGKERSRSEVDAEERTKTTHESTLIEVNKKEREEQRHQKNPQTDNGETHKTNNDSMKELSRDGVEFVMSVDGVLSDRIDTHRRMTEGVDSILSQWIREQSCDYAHTRSLVQLRTLRDVISVKNILGALPSGACGGRGRDGLGELWHILSSAISVISMERLFTVRSALILFLLHSFFPFEM